MKFERTDETIEGCIYTHAKVVYACEYSAGGFMHHASFDDPANCEAFRDACGDPDATLVIEVALLDDDGREIWLVDCDDIRVANTLVAAMNLWIAQERENNGLAILDALRGDR